MESRLHHHLCPYCQYVFFYETHACSTAFVNNYTEFHKNATINGCYYIKDDRRRLYIRSFFLSSQRMPRNTHLTGSGTYEYPTTQTAVNDTKWRLNALTPMLGICVSTAWWSTVGQLSDMWTKVNSSCGCWW